MQIVLQSVAHFGYEGHSMQIVLQSVAHFGYEGHSMQIVNLLPALHRSLICETIDRFRTLI